MVLNYSFKFKDATPLNIFILMIIIIIFSYVRRFTKRKIRETELYNLGLKINLERNKKINNAIKFIS